MDETEVNFIQGLAAFDNQKKYLEIGIEIAKFIFVFEARNRA
jgi:hypothetical protein